MIYPVKKPHVEPGQVVRDLTVLGEPFAIREPNGNRSQLAVFACACGNVFAMRTIDVRKGCGCPKCGRERTTGNNRKTPRGFIRPKRKPGTIIATNSLVSPGDRFGSLVVLGMPFVLRSKGGGCTAAVFQCACGNVFAARLCDVRRGHSCNECHLRRKRIRKPETRRHVKRIRIVWRGIKTRCYNQKSKDYRYYGARGIYMCDEWRVSFSRFYEWAISSGYQHGLEIDRRDNDGPYAPWNCRFLTRTENMNNCRNTRFGVAFGERKSIGQWQRDGRLAVSGDTLRKRLRDGWDLEKAIVTPTLTRQEAAKAGANGRYGSVETP